MCAMIEVRSVIQAGITGGGMRRRVIRRLRRLNPSGSFRRDVTFVDFRYSYLYRCRQHAEHRKKRCSAANRNHES